MARWTMPAKKKASAIDNLNARLSLVVKSGKISLGHRTTVKALRKSQAKLVLIAKNCPPVCCATVPATPRSNGERGKHG